jgi:hypothetical protein
MKHVLVAHCPTPGCYMRVPVCALTMDTKVEFDPTTYVVVTCPSCGKEFREQGTLLDLSLQADVTGKMRLPRIRVQP